MTSIQTKVTSTVTLYASGHAIRTSKNTLAPGRGGRGGSTSKITDEQESLKPPTWKAVETTSWSSPSNTRTHMITSEWGGCGGHLLDARQHGSRRPQRAQVSRRLAVPHRPAQHVPDALRPVPSSGGKSAARTVVWEKQPNISHCRPLVQGRAAQTDPQRTLSKRANATTCCELQLEKGAD